MKIYVDSILRQHGQQLTLLRRNDSKETDLRAFIQPHLKKQLHPPVTATPLGAVSEQRWTYIGPGNIDLSPGDRLRQNEAVWTVQETHTVCCSDEILYRWALLQPTKEAAI